MAAVALPDHTTKRRLPRRGGERTVSFLDARTATHSPLVFQSLGNPAGALLAVFLHTQSPPSCSGGHDVLSAGDGGNFDVREICPAGFTTVVRPAFMKWYACGSAFVICIPLCTAVVVYSSRTTIANMMHQSPTSSRKKNLMHSLMTCRLSRLNGRAARRAPARARATSPIWRLSQHRLLLETWLPASSHRVARRYGLWTENEAESRLAPPCDANCRVKLTAQQKRPPRTLPLPGQTPKQCLRPSAGRQHGDCGHGVRPSGPGPAGFRWAAPGPPGQAAGCSPVHRYFDPLSASSKYHIRSCLSVALLGSWLARAFTLPPAHSQAGALW